MLDVACGTGSAAIRAAQSGARVVGLDLMPPLFDAARREAAQGLTGCAMGQRRCGGAGRSLTAASTSCSRCSARRSPRASAPPRVSWRGCSAPAAGLRCSTGPRAAAARGSCCRCWRPRRATQRSPPLGWGNEARVRRLFAGSGVRLSFGHEIARSPAARGRGSRRTARASRWGRRVADRVSPRGRAARQLARGPSGRDLVALCAADGERADGHYLVVLGRRDG